MDNLIKFKNLCADIVTELNQHNVQPRNLIDRATLSIEKSKNLKERTNEMFNSILNTATTETDRLQLKVDLLKIQADAIGKLISK